MNLPWWIALFSLVALAAAFFWPRYGLRSVWREAQAHRARVQREDTLKHIYTLRAAGQSPTVQSVAGALQIDLGKAAAIIEDLEKHGLLSSTNGALALTDIGQEYALQIVRAHRLWERYLADRTGYDRKDWHREAERQEHRLTPEAMEALAAQLGNPRYDPHGDPIPTETGELRPLEGQSLASLEPRQTGRIVHLEDEPAQVYEQLMDAGLHVGMQVRVTDKDAQSIRFQAEGRPHSLTHFQAGSVEVQPLEAVPAAGPPPVTLAQIPLGGAARIVRLSAACQGAERRRLLDLGFIPGTQVKVVMRSPGGDDLRAYEVRGTQIALRREQAEMLLVDGGRLTADG